MLIFFILQMASFPSAFLVVFVLCLRSCPPCDGRVFSFQTHHRSSDIVKNWSDLSGRVPRGGNWHPEDTLQYNAQSAALDGALRGTALSRSNETISFSDSPRKIHELGYLHFVTVSLGTPGMKFLVALDTGSSLFWVPCDCNDCVPKIANSYISGSELGVYKSSESATSRTVACNNTLCPYQDRCVEPQDDCPYRVSYFSANTTTSGILLEDVLHMETEGRHRKSVEAFITFGCGQVQTGALHGERAAGGIFGLGMGRIAVPSILSREGYTADSFSMCFGRDGNGRISFGDKGSSEQKKTQFNDDPSHYWIAVTRIRVGTTLIDFNFTALFDSGASFTCLQEPLFTRLSEAFHLQVQSGLLRGPDMPFEYCYHKSPVVIPSLSMTMQGGAALDIYDPTVRFSAKDQFVRCCLAITRTEDKNIIGQNFMTGYRMIFNREEYTLGWQVDDCHDALDQTQSSISTLLQQHVQVTNKCVQIYICLILLILVFILVEQLFHHIDCCSESVFS